jgi:hypothetical protein
MAALIPDRYNYDAARKRRSVPTAQVTDIETSVYFPTRLDGLFRQRRVRR